MKIEPLLKKFGDFIIKSGLLCFIIAYALAIFSFDAMIGSNITMITGANIVIMSSGLLFAGIFFALALISLAQYSYSIYRSYSLHRAMNTIDENYTSDSCYAQHFAR
jgi:hypothetical protein